MRPWLHSSHWPPIPLVPQCNPGYTVLIGPPSHWSPPVTFPSLLSLVSLVPECNPGYTVLIGSPSHWFPSLTPSTLFSLVPHLIGPPMRPWLHSSHWFPISLVSQRRPWLHSSHWFPILLVPQCDHDYTVLIGPPSHWPPQCDHDYTVLIGPPSHWSPSLTPSTLFSCTLLPWLHSSHWFPISHWSPNVIMVTQHSLVPLLIGPPL